MPEEQADIPEAHSTSAENLRIYVGGLGERYVLRLAILAPLLLTLPLLRVLGKSPYILLIWGAIYAAVGIYGVRLGRGEPSSSRRRWAGSFVASWSLGLTLLFVVTFMAFLLDGQAVVTWTH